MVISEAISGLGRLPTSLIVQIVGALAALILAASPAAMGQEPPEVGTVAPGTTGSVRGIAFDSVGHRPLSEALILVLDVGGVAIRNQVRTDGQGRFRVTGLPVGRLVIVVEHARLEELGLTPILRTVDVRASTEVALDFATPSLAALWPLYCDEPQSDTAGVVYGRALDATTGVGQPGVVVTATWRGASGREGSMVAQADPSGSYRLCGVPTSAPVALSARFLDGSVVEQNVDLGASVIRHHEFAAGLGRASAIQGYLVDAQTGAPISDAEVTLLGTKSRAVTDVDGRFRFPDLEQGSYTLEIEHLAYGRQQKELLLGSRTLEVDARLSPKAIDLEGVTVSVLQPRLEDKGFYSRRRRLAATQATMLTGEDLLARDSVSLPWALRSIPATEMRMSGIDGPALQHRSRGLVCNMPVYLDGMLMVDVFNLASISPDEVLGVEVFPPQGPGVELLPEEFRSRVDYPGCGGVLIWTR